MRITKAFAVLSLLVLVAAPTVDGQEKAATKVDYLPLKVGNSWTYKVEFGGQNLSISQKVSKIEKKNNQDVASIDSDFGGQMITEQTSSTDKGVFRYSFQGINVDPPIQALKLPAKKGETWDAKFSIMGQDLTAKMKTEGEEDVTVPAGKYKAVIVAMDMEIMGQMISAKSWFAPNVGIVKQTFNFAGNNGTSELEKVELK